LSLSKNAFFGATCRKAVIAGILSALLVLPLYSYNSANAESFIVTTTKAVYTIDEKAIVLGVVPITAAEGYNVIINVTGPSGNLCSSQSIAPARDESFFSQPISLEQCGQVGNYTVTANYANLTTSSSFVVSGGTSAADQLELAAIKEIILNTQRAINSRVQEIFAANQSIDTGVAELYSNGTSEISLAMQSAQLGNIDQAKSHEIAAVKYFRLVLKVLASDVVKPEATTQQGPVQDQNQSQNDSNSNSSQPQAQAQNQNQAASQDNSGNGNATQAALNDRLTSMIQFYNRLVELAKKNNLEINANDSAAIESLFNDTQYRIAGGDFNGAENNMSQLAQLIEKVRSDLVKAAESQKMASSLKSSGSGDDSYGKRLQAIADKLQAISQELLARSNGNSDAVAKIQQAIDLIDSARSDISNNDYSSARQALMNAMVLLSEAKSMIDNSNNDANSSGSGGNGGSAQNSSQSQSQGQGGTDNSNNGNNGSNGGENNNDNSSNNERSRHHGRN
jgi:hypothetical protein